MRDYSGKKPHQYLSRPDTCISIDTFRSEYRRIKSSTFSSFERGGLYSSLRNSIFKLAPSGSSGHSESALDSKSSSAESCYSDQDGVTYARSNPDKRRQLAVSNSMLRELRPSIRRRAHSTSAFANNTT